MAQLKIPYESLDPLTIGASGDEAKVYREELELEIPDANLLAAIYPDEPEPVADATEAARAALESPVSGPRFSELLAGATRVAVVIDNQFRPTPQSRLLPAVFDAIEAAGKPAVVACANGKVFPMSESDIEQKIGRENLDRMERLGIPFHQNEPRNADAYTYVGVSSRGTPVWLHDRGRRVRPEDHDRPGAVEPLGRGRRRQADPARRRLRRDDRVEPLRVRPLAADALRRLRRPDALGHRRGGDDVRPPVHDERRPRHARPRDRVHLRLASRRAPRARSSASTRSTPTSTRATQADIAVCGVFAPTDHLFFHTGWGCMSADFVLKDGGTLIYTSPSPGVSTAVGDFPGLALMDLMKPYMPPTPGELPAGAPRHPRARDPDVGRLHLGADLRGDDAQAPEARHARGEPRDGGRHRHRRDHVARRGVRGGDGAARAGREGDRAPVRALPAAARTWCGWTPSRSASRRRRTRTDAAARSSASHGARHRRRRRRASREIKGSTTIVELLRMFPDGEAARLMSHALAALRPLRRRLPRAADDGGEAAPPRPARRARGLPRARAAADRRAGAGRGRGA